VLGGVRGCKWGCKKVERRGRRDDLEIPPIEKKRKKCGMRDLAMRVLGKRMRGKNATHLK